MDQDRIHAQAPTVDPEAWATGTIESIDRRDGHCVFTVRRDGTPVELTVTVAVRDLVVSRLDADDPVGEQVWFKRRGQ